MLFFLIDGINDDIIELHNNEDIEFFGQDFMDVALKCG